MSDRFIVKKVNAYKFFDGLTAKDKTIKELAIDGDTVYRIRWTGNVVASKSNVSALGHIFLNAMPGHELAKAHADAIAAIEAHVAPFANETKRELDTKTGSRPVYGFYEPCPGCPTAFKQAILACNAAKEKRDLGRPPLAGKWGKDK